MSTAPSTNGSEKKQGLQISRVFSKEGVHPFDEIAWAKRTAEIRDEKGKHVFLQEGVEFPENWSQLAVDIVSSKYFYGDLSNGNGSPEIGRREFSVKQMVRRVAHAIAKWGYDDGYFDSTNDGKAFEDELTWLLVQQHAAFNSPVWFNCGIYGQYGIEGNTTAWRWDNDQEKVVPLQPGESYKHPQLAACFLQSVEDTMDSIMDLAKSEAMLFKAGSGTGTNLSTLRSTKEKLAGGGKPSGPVSFFRVYDTIASIVKSGGKTRRAARLNCLNSDHPDIMEFISCKSKEDRKARSLIEAGYSAGLTGDADEAYSSVAFQNTNISIRVMDEFMRKASGEDADPFYWTKAVVDGSPVEQLNAKEVLRKIAEETWACGDPGIQYHDTINRWNTVSNTHILNTSNPCGEYNSIDDSSCNLASLNLMKFVDDQGFFQAKKFEAAVRIIIIAQDIIVDRASYPTEKIAQNTHDFRQLGIGYANLGTLLMTSGLPYDSDCGRLYAGCVAAIMQGAAARTSAEIASFLGTFAGFAKNIGPAVKVMDMHHDAVFAGLEEADQIKSERPEIANLWNRAADVWDHAQLAVQRYGYRNSQLSVTAPTGTISFLMDCQTTGCEPDIALVKYKKLAGGGMLKIVNQAVPVTLRRLGYGEPEIKGILDYIDANDTIEGAPGLNAKHLNVFDCAFPAKEGGRCIHWEGHARMLAATQPFISGSQSKTLNISKESTVDDIIDAYVLCWKLGVKSAAIYRDGSKGVQPLNTKKGDKAEPVSVPQPVPAAPQRKRLPDTRQSVTHKFSIGGHEGYLTVGLYPDGVPGELFVTISKEGSTVSGLLDSWATSVSLGLQYGVPLAVLVEKFAHSRYEPSGFSKCPDVPIAKSLTDYISRWLGCQFIDGYREANSPASHDDSSEPVKPIATSLSPKYQQDSPACTTCGNMTVRAGACYVCTSCGNSSGCG